MGVGEGKYLVRGEGEQQIQKRRKFILEKEKLSQTGGWKRIKSSKKRSLQN